jgi:hypothetical protein
MPLVCISSATNRSANLFIDSIMACNAGQLSMVAAIGRYWKILWIFPLRYSRFHLEIMSLSVFRECH